MPVSLACSQNLGADFDEIRVVPMVRTDEAGVRQLIAVIKQRVDTKKVFAVRDLMVELAQISGGVVRDLMRLVRMEQSESELLVQRICRSLRRTDREFALFFVVVNLPTARQDLAGQVRECLAQPAVELVVPAEGLGEDTLDGWLLPQLAEATPESVVFLCGLDRVLPAAE
ncbi:MAG: hypothetical protein D3903_19755 [Candidatus Electrothrix sp. GM3_4]|nr:hypothetical protein [Candidatus Electrothrix sp. GM3_4]